MPDARTDPGPPMSTVKSDCSLYPVQRALRTSTKRYQFLWLAGQPLAAPPSFSNPRESTFAIFSALGNGTPFESKSKSLDVRALLWKRIKLAPPAKEPLLSL